MLSNNGIKCPECGAEMMKHLFNGKAYYICPRCGKELIVPLSFF